MEGFYNEVNFDSWRNQGHSASVISIAYSPDGTHFSFDRRGGPAVGCMGFSARLRHRRVGQNHLSAQMTSQGFPWAYKNHGAGTISAPPTLPTHAKDDRGDVEDVLLNVQMSGAIHVHSLTPG